MGISVITGREYGTLGGAMGERTEYAPGTFCWSELTSTDQDAAKAFYGELLGWQADDRPVGEGSYYSMQLVDGKPVAAIAGQPQQQREVGVPSLWNSYVSVEDADAVAARAKELGANVHAPPFDVMTVGRMAVIQDPQGAFFMLWQPRDHIGASLVNAPGTLVWNELQSPDLDASASFYGELFGWKVKDFPNMEDRYLEIVNGEASNGGMRGLTPPSPPSWLTYFGVEDIEQGLAKVEELGGTKLAGPIDIQMAKIAVVMDPQGAVFALYAGVYQP
jgi:predicted enzyme related to lactoylglutathione lyase